MNNLGFDFNERYFSDQGTNRNYTGPLDMPWLEKGMAIAQWKNGTLSSPLDDLGLFYHPSEIKNNSYPGCLCFWKIKHLKSDIK